MHSISNKRHFQISAKHASGIYCGCIMFISVSNLVSLLIKWNICDMKKSLQVYYIVYGLCLHIKLQWYMSLWPDRGNARMLWYTNSSKACREIDFMDMHSSEGAYIGLMCSEYLGMCFSYEFSLRMCSTIIRMVEVTDRIIILSLINVANIANTLVDDGFVTQGIRASTSINWLLDFVTISREI